MTSAIARIWKRYLDARMALLVAWRAEHTTAAEMARMMSTDVATVERCLAEADRRSVR